MITETTTAFASGLMAGLLSWSVCHVIGTFRRLTEKGIDMAQ